MLLIVVVVFNLLGAVANISIEGLLTLIEFLQYYAIAASTS